MTPVFHHVSTPLERGTTVIAASAGTGKTFTIATIVVRLIAELGIPIQRLLLTTYTVAATAELRDRIRSRLIQALDALQGRTAEKDGFLADLIPTLPPEAAERLAHAIRDFDEASIHTIHGFCQRALREQAFETGAPFDAELLADATALLRETVEDYWRQHVYPAPPIVATAIGLLNLTPAELLKTLRQTSNHPRLRVLPVAASFSTAIRELESTLQDFRSNWPSWHTSVKQTLVDQNHWAKGDLGRRTEVQAAFDALHTMHQPDADSLALADGCAALCKFTSSEVADCTRKRQTPPQHPLFTLCDRFAAARDQVGAALQAHFLAWAHTALDQKKRECGVLLFEDLLTRLHAALTSKHGAGVARQLGGRFDGILVDEFQDTDPLQAEIFTRLFGTENHRLFLIGDPKQAIYGFRGADLLAYLSAVKHAHRHYTLRENQRSTACLVSAVNELFVRPALPFLEKDVSFEPVAAAGRADKEPLLFDGATRPPFHFWIWQEPERIKVTRGRTELPRMVAGEILRLLQAGPRFGERAVTPGDCAVLCMDNFQAREMARALARAGLPAVVLSNANIFASEEAAEFRLILAALAEPGRESLLRTALTTTPLGLNLADLVALQTDVPAWEEIRRRWQEHHRRWKDHGFTRMFRVFMREEGIRPRLLALHQGERRLTNFQHLAELLHTAAETQHLGPTGLIHWFDQQIVNSAASEENELRLERDDAAVTVITIHKSKGLEYPIVFCPFLWVSAAPREDVPPLCHDHSGDLVLDLHNPADPVHVAHAADERLAEQMRLLYVALTRAKYECHVVWGAFENGRSHQAEASGILRLLHPAAANASTFAELRDCAQLRSPAELTECVESICGSNPDLFACHTLPGAPVGRMVPPSKGDEPMQPLTFDGRIERSWRTTSYSALVAIRETRWDEDDEDRTVLDGIALEGIHAFPRGTKAGSCWHDLLEHIDFTAPDDALRPYLARKLRQHAMFTDGYVPALHTNIEHIRSLLPAGALNVRTSLRELEFYLPAHLLTPAQLADFAGGPLIFEPQRGILRGFIDVAFENCGRFYVLDWKSNWLGPTADSYTTAAMEAEMRHYRYGLQRELYSFALHRFLQVRMPDYCPEAHLGGAWYVFLRGLDPARPELGILQTPPDLSAIAKMERLFPKP